jgi:hypothetical protein
LLVGKKDADEERGGKRGKMRKRRKGKEGVQ